MGATRADVARLAGVSPSTVTYVLTGTRSTSVGTRERVHRAIEELGYHPNSHASMLAARSARTVGVLFRLQRHSIDVNDLDYVDGVRQRIEPEGIHVVVPLSGASTAGDDLVRLVRSRTLDAAILMDVAHDDERERILTEEHVPTVLIGTSGTSGTPSIDVDFRQMAKCALGHLMTLGHRRVVFLARRITRERSNAFLAQKNAVERAARVLDVEVLRRTVADSVVAGASLLTDRRLPRGCTAVVSNNPEALKGLLAAAWSHGVGVPDDFSVVSMGQAVPYSPDGRLATEVGVGRVRIGRRAGELLLQRLAEPQAAVEHLMVRASLADRGSAAAAGELSV